MEYKRLSECAEYKKKRTSDITFENYITTDNMLPNKGGITIAASLPDAKTASMYEEDDILLSNIRPYFRKIWYATRKGSCSNDVLVIKNKSGYISKFLYYVLCDNNFFNYDTITSKGTKMPRGTPNAIMKYLVPDISIDKQKKIVNILSGYDQLIENNNKRIKQLEQIAENIYKEWFVRFRFPGHETAEFENGIPKNWNIKHVGEIGQVVAGGTPSTEIEEYWNGDIPWLTPADLSVFNGIFISSGSTYITELGLKKSSATIMPKNTVLLSSRAPIGYVALARNEICTNQGFKNVICDENVVNHYYLYWYFKMNKAILEAFGSGATFLELSSKGLKKVKVIVPSIELQMQFAEIMEKISEQVYQTERINVNLTKQRDYLLPRLMSGKIKV